MDETIRVKIIADTTQVNSSLKQVNKEAKDLTVGGNSANAAIDKLDRTLNSLGFKGQRLAALKSVFDGIKKSVQGISTAQLVDRSINDIHKMSDMAVRFIGQIDDSISNLGNGKGSYKSLQGLVAALTQLDDSKFLKSRKFREFAKDLDAGAISIKNLRGRWDEALISAKARFLNFGDQIKSVGSTILGILGKIGKVAAGLFAAFAIKNAFDVSRLGDDIDKMSQKVGMSTRAYQQWAYILDRSGVEVTTLQSAMRQLTRKVGNNDIFARLGIADATKLNATDLFQATVSQLQKVESSTERARLAYQAFGQQYSELMPVLNMTNAETAQLVNNYNSLNASMNYGLIKASAALQDAITDLKLAFQGLKNQLGAVIIPVLTQIVILITKIISGINGLLSLLFGTKFYDIEEPLADVVMGDIEGAADGIADATDAAKQLLYLIAGFDELNRYNSNGSGGIGGIGGGGTPIGFTYDRSAFEQFQQDAESIPGLFTNYWSNPKESVFESLVLPWVATLDKTVVTKWLEQASQSLPKAVQEWAAMAGEEIGKTFEENDWLKGARALPGSEEAKEAGRQWATATVALTNPMTGPLNLVKGLAAAYSNLIKQLTASNNKGTTGFQKLSAAIKYLPDYFKKLNDTVPGIKKLSDTIKGIGTTIKNSRIAELWKGVVNAFKNSNLFKTLDDIKTRFKTSWENIWSPLKEPFEKWTKPLKSLWNELWGITDEGTSELVKATEDGLKPVPEKMSGVWSSVTQWYNQNVAPWFSKDKWKQNGENVSAGLDEAQIPKKSNNIWGQIVDGFNSLTGGIFSRDKWKNNGDNITGGLEEAQVPEKTNNIWKQLTGGFNTLTGGIFTADYWKQRGLNIQAGLDGINIDIPEKINEATQKVSMAEIFTKKFWQDKFGVIPEGLKNINLGDNPQQAAEKIAKKVQEALNGIIWKFNNSTAFNSIAKILGIKSLPYISLFAKGGVISEPTLGLMGEYPGARSNPEIVTPERKLTQIFENSNDDIVGVLVQGFRQIISAIDDKDLSVSLGDTQIAKSAARGNNQYRLQTGTSLF